MAQSANLSSEFSTNNICDLRYKFKMSSDNQAKRARVALWL